MLWLLNSDRSYAALSAKDCRVPKLQSIAAKAVKAGLLASIQVSYPKTPYLLPDS